MKFSPLIHRNLIDPFGELIEVDLGLQQIQKAVFLKVNFLVSIHYKSDLKSSHYDP